MNYIRKADLYKLIAKLKQNWGLDKNEYNLDIIRALKKSDSKKELGFFIISIIIEI